MKRRVPRPEAEPQDLLPLTLLVETLPVARHPSGAPTEMAKGCGHLGAAGLEDWLSSGVMEMSALASSPRALADASCGRSPSVSGAGGVLDWG
ncbi:hypothetical protein DPX16_5244 [Anabarilius grahami]|uniref:Uncharacterized protein n=1 Tax=Anabarilius grahami TaxID=495550 RepID=A0A3N0Y285_ANAGA|nr:hypothetical protein DPX16_5244 [Anabarilius grahami]